MEIEKIKMPIREALLSIEEMINMSYLCKVAGISNGTIREKMYPDEYQRKLKFTQRDVDKLNKAFREISEHLLHTQLSNEPSDDLLTYAEGNNVVEQIQNVDKAISMPYIYRKRMGKNDAWFRNRKNKKRTVEFSDDDILTMNMIIREIAYKLFSIELTL